VDDTYGLTDIYKLEVFTDLHPRKFILKGLARVEGQVRPDFSQFTAILVNPRTGNVVDQAKLEDDGSYTLDALSGDLELQFKGKDIESKVEKLNIPINNPSNIVSHTTVLTSLISPVVAPVLAEETVPAGPELGIAVREYVVTSGQSIPIRLDLERNTKLKVETLLDGELIKTEDFDIKRRRFVYMLTPKPGTNILRFTLTDAEGRSSTDEVTVIYTPSEEAVVAAPAPTVISEADRYLGLAMMAQGNLEKFMNSDEFRNQHFDSMADLYEYLAAHAAENNFTLAEVEELLARFLSQKELGYFYTELKAHSSDSLVKTLEKLDLKSKNIYTSEALLDYLYKNAASYTYNLDDLREALYQIAAANRDPLALVELLASYSQGSLADVLNRMKQDIKSFPNTRTVADYLLAGAQKGDFPVADLELALRKAAAELDMYFLYEGLLFISGDSLQNTLLGIDMKTENIRNSLELITFLMSQSDKGGYTKRELIDNIEKIRKDPYYYVDLFRRMLAEKATGSLKVFLQEIDIRGLEINTFEELVDYLLNQSQFHDFNREMVYQLLIDIIDPRNVKEFIDMLKLYGDERITRAINATDTEQFSRPIEVMQYLLSVADQYEYTERDLLRILLKMLLRKGPEGADGEDSQGWFAGLNKPALVTSLIVVNALIIIILILFIWRKKKKNDEVIGKE
jgi:AcrR family transcriptional regulator